MPSKAAFPEAQIESYQWKRSVSEYDDMRSFQFRNREEFRAAIDIFFQSPKLKGAPYQSVDQYCIVVPAEAAGIWIEGLQRKGIYFDGQPVQRVNRLSAQEAASIRKQAGFIYR